MEFRTELRSGTSCQHEALDRVVSRWDLSTGPGYRDFLRMHAAVLVPLEAWLQDQCAEALPPDWPQRQRTAALRADLEALDIPEVPQVKVDIPASRAAIAGVLYVLEGSRLGGRLLSREVETGAAKMPMSFFGHGHGMRLWQSFLNWLEAQQFSGDERPKAISAARCVFGLYQAQAASLLKEPTE